MSATRVTPQQLFANTRPEELCILDLRTTAEVENERVPGALHIPVQELSAERLQAELSQRGGDKSTVYLLCQSGRRADMAVDKLAGKVDCSLCIIDGGVNAMRHAPVELERSETPRRAVSIERQVRITAGLLILTGVVLGFTVNPGFFWLSGAVGAGLTFSGITDTCAMAKVLLHMPWNR
ncbi:rhodanese-like domain-containing protein [Marinimicrobium sp. LS-A18]|uniref:rhodanese-like domain-containing protein n=1 Tax=Marinimicrobium sp. LS-A18 TaxID=1381596 RepID=UPI000466C146|nr:rhodanese-like domain-containing protein [Marinimicrobium sp. LS-A18]